MKFFEVNYKVKGNSCNVLHFTIRIRVLKTFWPLNFEIIYLKNLRLKSTHFLLLLAILFDINLYSYFSSTNLEM